MTDSPEEPAEHVAPAGRALVLGGGGSTGNAWLIGVIAGLVKAGLNVTEADLIIGTSAGSTAAAQITGAPPAELFCTVLEAAPPQRPRAGSAAGPARTRQASEQLERSSRIIAAAANAADFRRRMGQSALETATTHDPDAQQRWRATVAARLPAQDWPRQRLVITAVEAESGEPVAFDRHSGVALVDAVAASCSNGFAYGIDGSHYIDGGYRSNADNADLAAGCARVLVLSPLGSRSRTPASWGMHLDTQVARLRESGGRVEVVVPDQAAEHLFGANAMDLSLRPPAARAGYDQGRNLAAQLTEFWS